MCGAVIPDSWGVWDDIFLIKGPMGSWSWISLKRAFLIGPLGSYHLRSRRFYFVSLWGEANPPRLNDVWHILSLFLRFSCFRFLRMNRMKCSLCMRLRNSKHLPQLTLSSVVYACSRSPAWAVVAPPLPRFFEIASWDCPLFLWLLIYLSQWILLLDHRSSSTSYPCEFRIYTTSTSHLNTKNPMNNDNVLLFPSLACWWFLNCWICLLLFHGFPGIETSKNKKQKKSHICDCGQEKVSYVNVRLVSCSTFVFTGSWGWLVWDFTDKY